MRVLFSITALLSAGTMLAQVAPVFPTPAYFRRQFSAPQTRVELQPPVRLRDFVVGDKLELSLKNYLELVMANNTDVAIQRLSVEQSQNSLIGAFGRFDPTLSFDFSVNRRLQQATSELEGAPQPSTLQHNGGLIYNQTLGTGTRFTINFSDTRTSSNSSFSTFNPSHSGSLRMNFTQPLLRNRGSSITKLPITIARSNLRRSEYDFRNQLLNLIEQAERAYWSVVEARETLKVQEAALVLKKESLKRSERELELGAISPLDIYQPRADVATAEIEVSNAKFALARAEDALRRMIGVDLDPDVRKMPIELTEGVLPPATEDPIDAEAEVQKALNFRPDLKSSAQQLDIDDLNIRQTRNLLRPQVDLTGSYTSAGVGGSQAIRDPETRELIRTIPGGFGDFVSSVFGFNLPTYQMGISVSFPIRDRTNEAALANNLLRKKQDTLALRNAEQSARLAVLNAVNNLESAKEGVKLAQIRVELAQKQADAEQQKYDLGTQIMFFVLQAQDRLNSARSELVRRIIAYQNARTALLRQTGELLDERGIVIK